jgi:LysM repeat protein
VLNRSVNVNTTFVKPVTASFVRGNRSYELGNHLGNVLAVISDKKFGHDGGSGIIDYFDADMVSGNDYYPFGMMMPGRKYSQPSAKYRYSINGQEKESDLNENITSALYWEYDSRIGRRWNADPVVKEYESPYSCFSNNPILSTDILGDDSNDPKDKHKIKKGETLSGIAKKYAVSVKDLQAMNDIKNPNIIKAGQEIFVNPERNFLIAPYADPANNNGINAQYSEVKNLPDIAKVAFDFTQGKGSENTVYTGGSGLNMVQTMPAVRNLVGQGVTALLADGKLKPGEVFTGGYTIGKIYGPNGRRIFSEQFQRKFLGNENDNIGLYGAEGILGSFSLSMRVLADGYTISIAVYNSSTIRSASDGVMKGTTLRRTPFYNGNLSGQYQRFLWDLVLCAPGLNQKKK